MVLLPELDDDGWVRFAGQITAEAGHLAALLDGEVPRTLVASTDAADVALLPGIGELETRCGCPEVGDPCVHSAALAHQLAWLLDDDPFLLLLLRGRGRDELLGTLAAPPPAPLPPPRRRPDPSRWVCRARPRPGRSRWSRCRPRPVRPPTTFPASRPGPSWPPLPRRVECRQVGFFSLVRFSVNLRLSIRRRQ